MLKMVNSELGSKDERDCTNDIHGYRRGLRLPQCLGERAELLLTAITLSYLSF
jgi:hypothetical protein